jgi:anti-repressor protein
MDKLIPINYNSDRPTVTGRALHEFLGVNTRYNDWFERMAGYGFAENVDFQAITQKRVTAQGNETTYIDHQLTIDMSKELCMIQRTERGKQARQYFIEVEKAWNSPEMVMSRALKMAEKKIASLEEEQQSLKLANTQKEQIIGELKPKADFVDTILKNKGLVTITQIAKDYGMSAQQMNETLHDLGVQFKQSGQWLLYREHHDKGYTHSETIDIVRSDGRPDVKMNTKWTQKGRLFIYNTLKDVGILPVIERTGGG